MQNPIKKYANDNYCETCEKFFPGKTQKKCPKCGQILRYKPRINVSRREREYVRY